MSASGLVGAIRKKLPSRNTALFWGTVFGGIGFYKYNKNESDRRLKYYCDQAATVANQPIGALDTVRKVHVYIAPPMGELGTRKARMHWEQYILPVFAAGALDYELTLVNDTETVGDNEQVVRGGVHRMVAEEIKERRRRALEAEEDSEELRLWRQAIDQRNHDNEVREFKNLVGREPQENVLGLWKPEAYPGVMDVVAIGRETWVEAVNGVSDGAVGSLNYTMPKLVKLDSEDNKDGKDAGGDELLADNATAQVVIDYDRYGQGPEVELPAVAYISHYNLTGWGSLPRKIWNFFHDQQNVDLYSSQALRIVLESSKRPVHGVEELAQMGAAEEELPSWEGEPRMDVVVDERVAARLFVYDTQEEQDRKSEQAAAAE
ncbi:mitochondrial import inner membrane translocase subunit tim54 [Coemansia sp. Benny D115]|nr:mitochondrial import inner membrane translocase subunit tim54 [Coemansia sp. Benny D115]